MGKRRLKPVRTHQTYADDPNARKYVIQKFDADKPSLTDREHKGQSNKKERFSEQKKGNAVEKYETKTRDIFPNWLPWILFPLTLSLRILYVLEPTNWWILHPDEIFQTIEVAHSDTFGYGFRPYEYLPPPENDVLNSTTVSAAHAQEIGLGMYSLRSFILPKLLSSVMSLANICRINTSPYLIVKVLHVIMTSLLPVFVFQFSRKLYHSKDVGCLSAVLVSLSLSLNVFGTHTIINSFLSPFLFLSLVPLLNLFDPVEQSNIIESKGSQLLSSRSNTNAEADSEILEQTEGQGPAKFVSNGKISHQQTTKFKGPPTTKQLKSSFSGHDENANVIYLKKKFTDLHAMNYCGFENGDAPSSKTDEYKARIQIEVPKYVGVLFFLNIYEAVAAFGLALCFYVRADLILIPLLLLLCSYDYVFSNISKFLTSVQSYLLGLVSGILIGGYCDYVTYGRWFLSPYQWYKFNVWNSYAGGIFGVRDFSFYVLKLYQNEPLVLLSFTVLLIDFIISVTLYLTRNAFTANIYSQSAKNQSFAIFVLLLLAFSLNGHKELRFMHNAIIFMYIAVARAIFSIHEHTKRLLRNQNNRQYSVYGVYIFIVLFTSSHFYYFLNTSIDDRSKWSYARNTDSHETNVCLDFIRRQGDVSGVFMDRSLQMSGAYSVLHQDVPIFALNMFEYIEYKQAELNAGSELNLKSMEKKGYSTFTDIADFISIRNSQYLMKTLLTQSKYNYLILGTFQDVIDVGYEEVFRVGHSKILKRKCEVQTEFYLKNVANKLQIHWNATILEYEGDWLKHFGLYKKAEKRLIVANRVDPKRIGTFRILIDMYRKLRYSDYYTRVLNACIQLYKNSDCLEPYVPLMIHRGYYRKIS